MLLPGGLKIEALIGRGELPRIFQAAPDLLGLSHVMKDFHAGDAFVRLMALARAPLVDRSRRPWSSRTCLQNLFTFFGFGRPLQRNVNKE